MVKKSQDIEQGSPRWFIDLNWYEENGRSFFTLAQGCLCHRCRQQLKAGEISAADLVANVRDCSSGLPGFINGELAILAIVFRLFLANGNQPLGLTGLSEGLSEWLGGDNHCTSAEFLYRLLKKDQRYYGIRRVLN